MIGNKRGRIIRVLYGDISVNYPKLKREVMNSLNNSEFARDHILHYVMGESNAQLLSDFGAKHVTLVDKRYSMHPSCCTHFWNKTYIIYYAMEVDGLEELAFVDFDSIPTREMDDRFWAILRGKRSNIFNGAVQIPSVGYKSKIGLTTGRGGLRVYGKDPLRKTWNTSFIYCRDKSFMKSYLDAYHEYASKTGWYEGLSNDEWILLHYIDKTYGVLPLDDMIEEFEPAVTYICRGLAGMIGGKNPSAYPNWPEAGVMAPCGKKEEDVYFAHA